jgi:hypothetical protein
VRGTRSVGAIAAWVLPAFVLLASCGGGKKAAAPAHVDEACDRWIAALSSRGILPDDMLTPPIPPRHFNVDVSSFSPRDRAAVFASYHRACVDFATVDGSTMDSAYLDRCKDALVALALGDTLPVACVPPPGTYSEGESCIADHQCASLNCAQPDANRCGTCAPSAHAGDYCAHCVSPGAKACYRVEYYGCGFGLECTPDQCRPRVIPNTVDPCTSVTCADGTYCDLAGTCVPLPGAGMPCYQGKYGDLCAPGFGCADEGLCVPARALGEPCGGLIGGAPRPVCEDDAYCKVPSPPPASNEGVCTRPALGEPCADSVECGRRLPFGSGPHAHVSCLPSTCAGPWVCLVSDVADVPPGERTVGACALTPRDPPQPCGTPCARLAADGEACGPDAVCLPRSECVANTCHPVSLGCQ